MYNVKKANDGFPFPYTHISPVDFTVSYTSANTITVTGAPFTVSDSTCIVTGILHKTAGGRWQRVLVNGVDTLSASANVITVVSDKSVPFSSGDSFIVGVIYQEKGYSSSSDVHSVLVTNPTNTNFTSATLAAVTNGTDGSYSYYIDCEGYRYHGIQWVLNEGTGTISGSLALTAQNDGTAPASCAYTEVSPDFLGVSFITASDYTIIDTPVPGKYLRVKIDASASNTADWTIYHVGVY